MVYEKVTDINQRVQMKLRGKNLTDVSDTADVEEVTNIVARDFSVIGQACTACPRAIAHTDLYDTFIDRVVDCARTIKISPGDEYNTGPQVSESGT